MPPKKAVKPTEKCDLCAAAIVDGKEDALQCEGTCRQWYHRYCAGVSTTHFKQLAHSATPFVCFACSQAVQQATVGQLHAELTALKTEVCELRTALADAEKAKTTETSLRDEVAALKVEVNDLRSAVHTNSESASDAQSWSDVVRRRNQKDRGKAKGSGKGAREKFGVSAEGAGNQPDTPAVEQVTARRGSRDRQNGLQSGKVRVAGVRRIWGTMKSCPTTAVALAIKRLTVVGTKLTVKRKFKKNENGKVKWWFLLKGAEDDLLKLEGEWQKVELQTAWKLEVCYQQVPTEGASGDGVSENETIAGHIAASRETNPTRNAAPGDCSSLSSQGSGTMQPSHSHSDNDFKETSATPRNVTRPPSPSQGSQTMQQLQPDNTANDSTEVSNSDPFLEEP